MSAGTAAASLPNAGTRRRGVRHSALVRVTHWVTALCFFALLVTGVEIIISHPRFYWGETGNVNTPALFELPIPASRGYVQTGYDYVLPDQNGWSRALHFQAAWLAVLTGTAYLVGGLLTGHFRRRLAPARADLAWSRLKQVVGDHLRLRAPDTHTYNPLQRLTYLGVVFVLAPTMLWTGLAMSPAFTAAFPWTVESLGGHQSARTLHFFLAGALLLFLAVHLGMIVLAGVRRTVGPMITGGVATEEDR